MGTIRNVFLWWFWLAAAVMAGEVTTVWGNSASDGDLNNADNWTNGRPDGTDSWFVVFDGAVSNVAPTVNLDAPKTHAWNTRKWTFLESYTVGVGTPSDHLELRITSPSSPTGTVSNTNVTVKGGGIYHIEMNAGDRGDAMVDAPFGLAADNEVFFYDLVRNLWFKGGRVTVDGGCTTTETLFMQGHGSVTIERGSVTRSFTTHVLRSGGFATDRDTATGGSVLKCSGGAAEVTGVIERASLIHVDGGYFIYDPDVDPDGEAPDIFVESGILDLSKTSWGVEFTRIVIGPTGTIFGDYIVSDAVPSDSVEVDLRLSLP